MNAGEKIRKYRELCKLTQQELADLSEINVATIKKYELGQRNPKPEQLDKIAKGLGFNPVIFYELDLTTVGDIMSLLFLISDVTYLDVVAPDNHKWGFFLRLVDGGLMDKLEEWTKISEALTNLENSNAVQSNEEIKKVVNTKINEMESAFRLSAMKDTTTLMNTTVRTHKPLLLPYFMGDEYK